LQIFFGDFMQEVFTMFACKERNQSLTIVPIKGTNYDKFKYPHSLTPTKTMGETEVRIETALANPEMVADMFDINLNPISHKFLIKNILESDKAFDPNFNIDRSIVEYGNTKSLAILQHIFNANGIELSFEE
jgi:hypothetical protein